MFLNCNEYTCVDYTYILCQNGKRCMPTPKNQYNFDSLNSI